MKCMKRWLGIMLSVMLAAGSLQVPAYAVEIDSTAAEAEIAVEEPEAEEPEITDASEDEEPVNTSGDESVEEVASDDMTEGKDKDAMDDGRVGTETSSDENVSGDSVSKETVHESEVIDASETGNDVADKSENGITVEVESDIDPEVVSDIEESVDEENSEIAKDASVDLTYGDFTYTVSGKNATITGYEGSASSLTVPSMIGEYTVTAIKSGAFKNCQTLTSITLPESVKTLGMSLFVGTGIQKITIPKSVTTATVHEGAGPLNGSAIEEVIFEEGIKAIPAYICSTSTSSLSNYTSCIKHVQIPDGVTSIGSGAFYLCKNLKEVDIPKEVANIGYCAFYGCSSMEEAVFHYNDEEVKAESGSSQLYSLTIENEAFSGCSSLTRIELSDNVRSIGYRAFARCSALGYVDLGGNITSIGQAAFSDCQTLTSITLPESVKTLGMSLFVGTGIKKIKIPKNVTTATVHEGAGPLNGSAIEEVIFEEGIKVIPAYICSTSTSSLSNYTSCIKHVQIPESVTEIGGNAFYNCKVLENVKIRKRVLIIGNSAFSGCSSLQNVYFEGYAPTIARGAFTNVTATAYYPENNSTWTPEKLQNYGGTITWNPYTGWEGDIPALDYLEVSIAGDVTVHWKSPEEEFEVSGYAVRHRIVGTTEWKKTKVSDGSSSNVTLKKLSVNDYEIEVCYLMKAGGSDMELIYSATATCPVPKIEILNPEPGSKYADSLGLAGRIHFDTDLIVSEQLSASDPIVEVYQGSDRIASYGEEDFNSNSSDNGYTLFIRGVKTINNRSFNEEEAASNPPENPFRPGTSYYVNIKEKSLKLLKKNGSDYNENVPVYFSGIKDKNTWAYTTAPQSYSSRENFEAEPLDRYFNEMYKDTNQNIEDIKSKAIDKNTGTINGVCFGLAYAISAYALNPLRIRQITGKYKQLSDVPTNKSSEFYDYIVKAQIAQYFDSIVKESHQNIGKYDKILKAIKDKDQITLRLYEKQKNGLLEHGHEIYPLGILQEDSSGVRIAVYDPDCKNFDEDANNLRDQTLVQELKFIKESGKITGFEYRNDEYAFTRNVITYVSQNSSIDSAIYDSFKNCQHYMITSTRPLPEAVNLFIIPSTNGDSENSGKYLYWCSDPFYHYECEADNAVITISDGINKLYAAVSAGMKVDLDLTDKTVSIDAEREEDYQVRFSEVIDDSFHDYVISGETGTEEIELKKQDGDIFINTSEEIETTITVEDDEVEKHTIKIVLPGRDVRICDNEKGIEVFADYDNDGVYDDAVDGSGHHNSISLTDAVVTGISDAAYSSKEVLQNPVVKVGNETLTADKDYVVSHENNINPGTATITITGIGNYTGTIIRTFLIKPGKTTRGDMFNLANNVKVTWKEVPGAKFYKVYREGITDKKETQKEPVIVTERLIGWDSKPGLTNGHAYRYRIVASLTGAGDSNGDSLLSYSKMMYRLKTVVIRFVKNTAAGKVTVKYDKTTSGDSYVLQYCERQDMVGAKTKVVLGADNTSYVIGGLKKGKTYYISIRVRKKVNGIDYYTTFGVPKKVTITK